jgi:hypothetical protein
MAAVTTQSETKTGAVPHAADSVVRILLLVLLLAAGLAVGTVGSFLHRAEFNTGSVAWPDGLLLSLGGLVGLMLALTELLPVANEARATVPARLPALAAVGVGWVVSVIWLTYVGPPFSFQTKGDVILADPRYGADHGLPLPRVDRRARRQAGEGARLSRCPKAEDLPHSPG